MREFPTCQEAKQVPMQELILPLTLSQYEEAICSEEEGGTVSGLRKKRFEAVTQERRQKPQDFCSV